MFSNWIFSPFVTFSFLFSLPPGHLGRVFMNVTIKERFVARNGYFEISVYQYSPSTVPDGLRAVNCGYKQDNGVLVDLTYWNQFVSPPKMAVKPGLLFEYSGRVAVRNTTIMRILNAKFTDESREFYCKLYYINQLTSEHDHIQKLVKLETVYDTPKVGGVPLPSSTNMSNIDATLLSCNFTGRPKVEVSWKYPNEIKGANTSIYHDSTGLTSTAGFLNITFVPKVCNRYKITCIGKHQFGKEQQSTMLDVTIAPEINNSSISHTVNEGERVTLSCKASGCPAPTVTWKKAGNDTFFHVGETYTFSYPVPEDDGEYICNATAQGPSRSEKGTLTILYRPTLDRTFPRNETLCLHKSVTLNCAALSGFPTPNVTLYNGSSILASRLLNLSYTITVSSAADFKQYHCIASNLVGFDILSITVNPAGKPTEPTDVALRIEEKVTMDITWKKPKCAGQHGISGYIIYYNTTDKSFKSSNKVNCCRHKLKYLQEGTCYEVYIVAVDGQGKEGMKSGIKTIETGVKEKSKAKHDNIDAIIGGSTGVGALVLIGIIINALRWRKNRHQANDSEKGRDYCPHDYDMVRKKYMRRAYDTEEENNYADLGSFGNKVPTPATNKNGNQSNYSAIENLGPLRIQQENSTSDNHLYDNL